MKLFKVGDFIARMIRFWFRRYNFDANNSDYLRKNCGSIEQNLPFAAERFYFRQLR